MLRKKLIFSFGLIFLIFTTLQAKIFKFQLKNGLKVYLVKKSYLPIVSINVVYKTGSKDEYNGITGIAHMLEHMNFRGSKHFKDGFFEKYVVLNGGIENASTSFDYTRYYAVIKKDALKEILKIYADNMEYLTIDRKKFLKERNVVYQERLWRIDNSPDGYLYYTLHRLSYLESPYRWTPIGFSSDILSWTRDDVYRFYKKHYAPNNAVIVICGDINVKKTVRLIKKYFGKYKKKRIQEKFTEEPPQKGQRREVLHFISTNKKIAISFHIPPISDNSTPVLDIITYMLFARENSILFRKLVREKRLCSSIYGGNQERVHSGLFVIFANLNKNAKFKDVEKIIWNEFENLKKGNFSRKDFILSKNRAIYDYFYSKETISGYADSLSFYAGIGKVDYFLKYPELIKKVTQKDIINWSKKIFRKNNSTIIELIPEKGKSISYTPKISGELR